MKKWNILFLCCALVLSLTACDTQTPMTETTEVDQSNENDTSTGISSDDSTEESEGGSGTEEVTGVTEIVSAQYDEAWPFSEGFAVVGLDGGDGMKYNYIDTEGQLLLEEWVDVARSFSEGLACVGYEAEIRWNEDTSPLYRFGYVDTSGELVIPAEILCHKNLYPSAFYQGYAEINYVIPSESNFDYLAIYSNVIDREGNHLIDVTIKQLVGSNAIFGKEYGYQPEAERILALEDEGTHREFYRYHDWMKAYVEGNRDRNIVLYPQYWEMENFTYLVDMDGNVLKTVESKLEKISEDYYHDMFYGYLYDKDLNLLNRGTYRSIEQTSWGNYVGVYMIRNSQDDTILLNQYMTPLTDSYIEIKEISDGYLIKTGLTGKWRVFDPDGESMFKFSESMSECDEIAAGCYTEEGYQENRRKIYIGTDRDQFLFDANGSLFYTGAIDGTNAEPQVTLLTEDGLWMINNGTENMIIDELGKIYLSLPDMEYRVYGANAERINLYYIENENCVLVDLVRNGETFDVLERGSVSVQEFDFTVEGRRIVLAENEESRIISEGKDRGLVTLERSDGTVLEENCGAVSLVSDGLYVVAGKREMVKVDDDVDVSGYEAVFSEFCLKYDGQAISEVYENMDVLSEGYIAFREDGKWGYLKIIATE